MAQAADNTKSKSRILIVVEGDRFIRVYSDDQHVSIKTVTVPFMLSQQGEILVDELLQQRLRLPRRGCPRQSGGRGRPPAPEAARR